MRELFFFYYKIFFVITFIFIWYYFKMYYPIFFYFFLSFYTKKFTWNLFISLSLNHMLFAHPEGIFLKKGFKKFLHRPIVFLQNIISSLFFFFFTTGTRSPQFLKRNHFNLVLAIYFPRYLFNQIFYYFF